MPIENYVAKLDAQLATCRNWSEAKANLPTPEADEEDVSDAVEKAFSVWFAQPDNLFDPGRFPHLVEPEAPTLAAWQAILTLSAEQIVQARLGELLWQLRSKPRPDLCARSAMAAYQALAERWEGMDAMYALVRALQLALTVKDTSTAATLVAAADSQFDATIEDPPPGVSFGYLEVLVCAPPELRPADLESRFARAKAVYAAQPQMLQQLMNMQKQLAGGDHAQRAALDREAIQFHLQAADASAGMTAFMHLQSAVDAAQNYPDLRDDALARLRGFDLTSLNLQTTTVELQIDAGVLRQHQEFFLGQAAWQDAMECLLALPPPSGRADANREQAQQLLSGSVLRFAMKQHVLNADTGLARTLDDEDDQELQLGEVEVRSVQVEAIALLVPVLKQLPARHRIERDALHAWLLKHHAGAESGLVEESLWRWWHGEDDLVCALILIPAIESLVRLRAEQRGLGVSTAAVGHHRAGFKSLGELLSALSGHMDESWRRYLICVLVNEYRLNLRNNLCHGIMLSASPSDVVVLLIAALYLLRLPAPAAPAVAEASNERAQPAE